MKDSCFIRGKVPMTKSEVRAVSLAKMNIQANSVIYDIGAGTGSISVEAALLADRGHVYAVEQNQEACHLIEENKKKFSLTNLTVVCGKAPNALDSLPKPDCVFIGGTGGMLREILNEIDHRNPKAQIVINTITLETQMQVLAYLEEKKQKAEIVTLQVSKASPLGRYQMMQAENPVTIITIGC